MRCEYKNYKNIILGYKNEFFVSHRVIDEKRNKE